MYGQEVDRKCLRCGYEWRDRGRGKPKRCARCRSDAWYRPRERSLWNDDRRLADVKANPLLRDEAERSYVERHSPAPRKTPWRGCH